MPAPGAQACCLHWAGERETESPIQTRRKGVHVHTWLERETTDPQPGTPKSWGSQGWRGGLLLPESFSARLAARQANKQADS